MADETKYFPSGDIFVAIIHEFCPLGIINFGCCPKPKLDINKNRNIKLYLFKIIFIS